MIEKPFVYVLRSTVHRDRYYCGITSNLDTRLETHNSGGSRQTREDRPWELVVSLRFANPDSALAFERYLKSGSGRAFAKRHFM
jgi:putative endonuclease